MPSARRPSKYSSIFGLFAIDVTLTAFEYECTGRDYNEIIRADQRRGTRAMWRLRKAFHNFISIISRIRSSRAALCPLAIINLIINGHYRGKWFLPPGRFNLRFLKMFVVFASCASFEIAAGHRERSTGGHYSLSLIPSESLFVETKI